MYRSANNTFSVFVCFGKSLFLLHFWRILPLTQNSGLAGFSPSAFNSSLHCLLAWIISDEKHDIMLDFFFYVKYSFSLAHTDFLCLSVCIYVIVVFCFVLFLHLFCLMFSKFLTFVVWCLLLNLTNSGY